MEIGHLSGNVNGVESDLDVLPEVVYHWRLEDKVYQQNSFPGEGNPKLTDEQQYTMAFKKQLKYVLLEWNTYERAAGIFSRSERQEVFRFGLKSGTNGS